ncbi:MAG TPA: homoserine kinase [Actinomycetota bacterium]|nr:homoserine kinase [Actinomycetota bacterium]
MDVQVSVPATSANLGPGFDCLGVALGIYLRIRFTSAPRSEIAGVGRHHPLDRNLTYRSFVSAYERAGKRAPAVRLETLEDYPSARGLGASASAIVAGLTAARWIGQLDLSDEALAEIATDIEGHPDNVLPALVGGLVLSLPTGWLRLEPTTAISPLLLVAREKFKTGKARRVLPPEVSREDAVAAASAASALVAVLAGRAGAEWLMPGTEDRLHEPYRLPLMPETMKLRQELRQAGVATALSGAGPSLISLVESQGKDRAAAVITTLLPQGWTLLSPGWDMEGAKVRNSSMPD